jgi:hypothetical protein
MTAFFEEAEDGVGHGVETKAGVVAWSVEAGKWRSSAMCGEG